MSSAVTVRDVMTREFVGVSESDGVVETVELLLEEGAECAIVLRGRDALGMLSERDALSLVASDTDPAATTVADVMSDGVVQVSSGESLAAAAGTMEREGVRWLLAIEEEDPVGVVTAHDVVVASTLVPEADTGTGPASTATDPEAEYDTQGICEACGALARDLVSVNGQLVCPNCRET
ncbi:CBS domain-containing protein [Halococcus agarilyticus]|uniref:CBS domain-containing protein n=1 Tax=Halococcus agarilyticus TaxID=1232219 RepID=UPI000677BCAF|nr:CBS domain-containing protein [Halococcus agarilyticus]